MNVRVGEQVFSSACRARSREELIAGPRGRPEIIQGDGWHGYQNRPVRTWQNAQSLFLFPHASSRSDCGHSFKADTFDGAKFLEDPTSWGASIPLQRTVRDMCRAGIRIRGQCRYIRCAPRVE